MKIGKPLALASVTFALLYCTPSTPMGSAPFDLAKAKATADQQVGNLAQLLATQRATGDPGAVNAYLKTIDTNGSLSPIVARFTAPPLAKALGTPAFPYFTDPAYKDGDVLLFSWGNTAPTGDPMAMVLVGSYEHSGVLDMQLVDQNAGRTDLPCIFSATLDATRNGITYQSYDELAGSAAVGRMAVLPPGQEATIRTALSSFETWARGNFTLYSFLTLTLDPISRWDPLFWYCSKVSWRVYYDGAGMNIENTQFYSQHSRWEAFRATTVYQLYLSILTTLIPSWTGINVQAIADQKLQNILAGLITPDEEWYYTGATDRTEWGVPLTFWSTWDASH